MSSDAAARATQGRFRRGAAILPSLFTTGNLFLGFWAIIQTLNGQYVEAAPLIAGRSCSTCSTAASRA